MKNTLNIFKQERKRTSEYFIHSKMCFSSNFWERIAIFWKITLFTHTFLVEIYTDPDRQCLDALLDMDPANDADPTGSCPDPQLSKNSLFGTGYGSVPVLGSRS
jgi:hypothetical protein